jgi:hypothetical protein
MVTLQQKVFYVTPPPNLSCRGSQIREEGTPERSVAAMVGHEGSIGWHCTTVVELGFGLSEGGGLTVAGHK